MTDITLSSAVRNNLLALQKTSSLLEKTQNRLATGLSVNSALDDPSAFFTASSLNSRASDLNRLLDSVGLAIQTVQAADDGLTAITGLVEGAQATARNALSASNPAASAASATGTIGVTLSDVAATSGLTAPGLAADVPASITGASLNNQANLVVGNSGIAEGSTLIIDNGTDPAVTFTFNAAAPGGINLSVNSLDDLVNSINDGTIGVDGITATNNGGQLDLVADNAGVDITIGGTVGAGAQTFGIATGTTASTNLLDIAGIAQSDTLTVQVGTNAATTVTFGDGVGEVNTIAGLQAAIDGNVAGASTASVSATGGFTLTAADNTDSIVIDGNSANDFGFSSINTTFNPTESTLINSGIVAQNDAFTITVGLTTTTLTFGTGVGEINTLAELDTQLEAITGVTSSVDSSGYLTIEASDTTTSITLAESVNTPLASAFGITPAALVATTANNITRAAAEAEFNLLLEQIDELAADASFNGNNLLDGDDLTVIFNEDGSSNLLIDGVTFDSAGLGISPIATDAFQTDANIDSTLDTLSTAITTLRTQASTFGSNLSVVEIRQDFTKNLINTLETGAAGLTLADSNEEAANLLALQTRQSLSSTSLSLASQADQNVLQLLR